MELNKHIVISQENYDKLRKLGNFGDTFDDVISRLLEEGNS
jgi:predicted CopG family antitoxin